MIFQHTLGLVLSGRKTATTRIWKDNYSRQWTDTFNYEASPIFSQDIIVLSKRTGRKLYYPGQKHSVQPGRTKKGVGTIEILNLYQVSILDLIEDKEFIYKEGFETKDEFLDIWRMMHGNKTLALHIRFKCTNL